MNQADADPTQIGRRVVLPATFTGSPRHMHKYAQDAMAYVRKYGRPDPFVTFTCNPKWEEIQRHLFQNQKPTHRHDVIARVFRLKLKKMMEVISKGKIFGDTICHMYSVEWQKRGLPHAHILVWLAKKIRPNQVDLIITAEIPDSNIDPAFYTTVTTNLLHGPCGRDNPSSPCMLNGVCSKRYPRQFIVETQTDKEGYPLYRRRDSNHGGHTFKKTIRGKEFTYDNRYVVPYSPILCKMFHAHINVEYCQSVKAIKYICKYVYKGSDQAVFELTGGTENLDEVRQFQQGRYISSNEAICMENLQLFYP
ncbi:uncharacterized protein LOC144953327 [Lampetra fluviatilis]